MQVQLNAIVYPVLTLPSEVVSEIFIHTLPEPRARPNVSRGPPPTLRRVQSTGVRLRSSHPHYGVPIELTFKFNLFGSKFLDLLELWLSRTGHHPLSLSLCYDEYTVTNNRPQLHLLVELVLRHSDRLADVELNLPDASQFRQFNGYFPALKALSLRPANPSASANPSIPAVTSFTHAPVILPWAQLTSLKCEALWSGGTTHYIPRSPNSPLSTPVARRVSHGSPSIPDTPRPGDALDLIRERRHTSLPRLPLSLRLLVRARKVSRGDSVASGTKIWRPQYFTDSFLLQLADPAMLLPNLESLELNHVYPIQFTMPALVGMLSARWRAPVRLQSFRTVLHKASMVTDPALAASGMRIHIDYH
ncbi:hypothetical protein C8R46DRAFT_1076704, partial [Mycena filopes]